MNNFFYSHLVEFDSVSLALNSLDISAEEKKNLEKLARNQLHHAVIGVILNELSARDKKIFLANVRYESQDKIWKHLNEKVEKIEEKISKAAQDLKQELHKDILELKNS